MLGLTRNLNTTHLEEQHTDALIVVHEGASAVRMSGKTEVGQVSHCMALLCGIGE